MSPTGGAREHLARRDPLSDRFLVDHALRARARELPDHPALISGDRALSYARLDEDADRAAQALVASGVVRGDRVLVLLENSVEAVVAFYGALRADAVPSLLGAGMRPRRFAEVVRLAEPSAIVAAPNLEAHLAAVAAFDGPKPAVVLDLDAAVARAPSGPPKRRSIELDLATICWTSGSTGEPKGVMLTHQNLRNSAAAIGAYLGHTKDDVILGVLPLSHTYGLFQLLVTHAFGGTLVLEKGFGMAWPIVLRMAELRVTGFAGVPTIFAALLALKDIAKADLSSLRYMTNAAYGLPSAQVLRLRELLPRVAFYAMYGQTECTRVSYLPPEEAAARPGSVGIAFPNEELWIEREDGTRALPGEAGELVVRGPNVMRGYWRDPEATARALRPGPLPGEVVLHTGDLFTMDADGYLTFVARKDDIIKTRGEKVSPFEVESVIARLDGVAEVAVVGCPDKVLGVAIKAVVVRAQGAQITSDDVKRLVRAQLDEVAVPKFVDFVDALPKTASGKVKKSELSGP